MTKWELFKTLSEEHCLPRAFCDANGFRHFGVLQSIEREDGSGHSFNVRIETEKGKETFHVRTRD